MGEKFVAAVSVSSTQRKVTLQGNGRRRVGTDVDVQVALKLHTTSPQAGRSSTPDDVIRCAMGWGKKESLSERQGRL